MKYPKLREIKEALASLFTKPYTSKFPAEPCKPAKGYRGKPVVDEKHCVGCETCANVCPAGAITFEDDGEKGLRYIYRDIGKCIFCGQCEEHCLTKKGVKLSDEIYEMAVFDRSKLIEKQEFELLVCENCGAIITAKKHIQYLHKKLGPKAFASIISINMLNERLGLETADSTKVEIQDGLKRKDMFNIICSNCMRKVQVKNLVN